MLGKNICVNVNYAVGASVYRSKPLNMVANPPQRIAGGCVNQLVVFILNCRTCKSHQGTKYREQFGAFERVSSKG